MSVSTELLAVLVTLACAIMSVNMLFMKSLWEDIKKIKNEQKKITVEQAVLKESKMDKSSCVPFQKVCRDEIRSDMSKHKEDVEHELNEQWERIHHHVHGAGGKVMISK